MTLVLNLTQISLSCGKMKSYIKLNYAISDIFKWSIMFQKVAAFSRYIYIYSSKKNCKIQSHSNLRLLLAQNLPNVSFDDFEEVRG